MAIPSLPGGNLLLGVGCATINAALHGDGPPCSVEEWQGDRTVRVERAGRKLRIDGRRGRIRWSQLANPLPGCLGDPLAVPPAQDPGATRTFDGERWILTFTGQNLCHLGGTLVLHATSDEADWSALTASDRPWTDGGLAAAWADLRADLRSTLVTRWATMDEHTRAAARQALIQDPHPDAARVLTELDEP